MSRARFRPKQQEHSDGHRWCGPADCGYPVKACRWGRCDPTCVGRLYLHAHSSGGYSFIPAEQPPNGGA
ncbi:MAG TPA: hypothetical protein VGL16_14920 [Actinomycetota bacterium]